MDASSSEPTEMARKNLSALLHRLSSVGQNTLAQGLGCSEPTVSRMKDKEFPDIAKMLAVLGLKAVPIEMKCYRPDAIEAIFTLARMTVQQNTPESLLWEE